MGKEKMTKLEKQWVLYDVGNSAFVMLVFIILLILIGLEIRRMKKEDTLQIILEDKTADEKM